ncbi:MAG TPA: zinc-binding dehydrogenase [Gemmatimonadaceae bacterium]|nr:zinc-binding dehydrogenase [Gemmatimonadaceae bacterium]
MKAITFAAPIPRYLTTRAARGISEALAVGVHACTRFQTVAAPDLPGDQWVRIRTRLGGICGSDLGIVALDASPSTSPFSSFPFVLGHENVGVIAELGRAVRGWAVGERVTVNPLLCCEPRAVSPPCEACARGEHSRCVHFTDGALPPGMLIGTTRSLGGSWGEEFVAHRSQLVRVAEQTTDAEAVLVEPFACCVHAVRAGVPGPRERVFVIGAGTMGLLTTAALRALAPETPVTVLARHAFQARHAGRLGAARVVLARGDYLGELADAAHTRLLAPIVGRPVGVGGFDRTYVCANGARGVEDALRFTRAGGTIVLLANVTMLRRVDWTPLWLKELTLRGTLAYGGPVHGGADEGAFVEALRLIAGGRVPLGPLVTHRYPLAAYRRALATARGRGAHESVKVVFDYGAEGKVRGAESTGRRER